jgi:hypothetical protein
MATLQLLGEGASMEAGDALVSPSGAARLAMQKDGNLVVYVKDGDKERVTFATHNGDTLGVGGVAARAILCDESHNLITVQEDGTIM